MPEHYVCQECGHHAVEIHHNQPGWGRDDLPHSGNPVWICPDPRCRNSIAKLNGRAGFRPTGPDSTDYPGSLAWLEGNPASSP